MSARRLSLILLSAALTALLLSRTPPLVAEQKVEPWDISWVPTDHEAVTTRIDSIIDKTGLTGMGRIILDSALSSRKGLKDGIQPGTNPAFALAMFRKEAEFAKEGSIARDQNNPGNIRCPGGSLLYGAVDCRKGFGVYSNMEDGVRAYFQLLNTVYKPGGTSSFTCEDIKCIVSRYCPPSECDTEQYIKQIQDWGSKYRDELSGGTSAPKMSPPAGIRLPFVGRTSWLFTPSTHIRDSSEALDFVPATGSDTWNGDVIAADDGEVIFAAYQENRPAKMGDPPPPCPVDATRALGFGNLVILYHPKTGYQTYYPHLSSIDVREKAPDGKRTVVTKGTKLGVMGDTGCAKGAHLHFEVRSGGGRIPLKGSSVNIRSVPGVEPDSTALGPPISGSNATGGSLTTMFALDVSGSMRYSTRCGGATKVAAAARAADTVVQFLAQEHAAKLSSPAVGVITFNDRVVTRMAPSNNFDQARGAIRDLRGEGGTDIYGVLSEAVAQSGTSPRAGRRFIILLTDGKQESPPRPDEDFFAAGGPVDRALTAGVTIHTVGVGDPGEFNQALLMRIASATRGEFRPACRETEVVDAYVRLRHASAGEVRNETRGEVGQGQTVTAFAFDVGPGDRQLNTTLTWPGSTLDLQLVDPRGQTVTTRYRRASVATTSTTANIVVDRPDVGRWTVNVFGRQVSQPQEPFYAIVSTRAEGAPEPPTPVGVSPIPIAATLGMTMVVGCTVLFALRRSRRPAFALAGPSGLRVLLRPGVTTIGRDASCGVRLLDEYVSRRHARLVVVRDGMYIEDLGSTQSTFVNGAQIHRASLSSGDTIRLGKCELKVL